MTDLRTDSGQPDGGEKPPSVVYSQSTGEISFNGQHMGNGWAGHGEGLNNPALQHVRTVGPLPQGRYEIKAPVTHPRLGPFAMELEPYPGNEMFGRDDFWIHGASQDPKRYHQESMGCIIAMRPLRLAIWATGCRLLEVVH